MEETLSPKAILGRLKQGTGSKTDKELAEKLGVAQQSVYNVNAKNKVPDGWVRKLALLFNLSTDWLYFGEGRMHRGEANAYIFLSRNGMNELILDENAAGSGNGMNEQTTDENVVVLDNGVNEQILANAVELVEEILAMTNRQLPPKTKGEIISKLYRFACNNTLGTSPPLRVIRMGMPYLISNTPSGVSAFSRFEQITDENAAGSRNSMNEQIPDENAVGLHNGVNEQVLANAVELVEEILVMIDQQLPPKTKGEIISKLYRFACNNTLGTPPPLSTIRVGMPYPPSGKPSIVSVVSRFFNPSLRERPDEGEYDDHDDAKENL